MSTFTDLEKDAASVDGFVNENGLIPTRRNGPKPSYQYLVDAWNAEIAAAILEMNKSRGFRVVGTFAGGFTYELFNDVGIDADGNSWIYVGAGAPNKVVAAGTVPSEPDYTQVVFSDHNQTTNRGLPGAHPASAIDWSEYGKAAQDVASSILRVSHLKNLANAPMVDNYEYHLTSFYDDWQSSGELPIGGGIFTYSSTIDKANHNGGTILDPDRIVAWDGTQGDLATLFTVGNGSGCFVATDATNVVDPNRFGAKPLTNSSLSFKQAANSLPRGGVVRVYDDYNAEGLPLREGLYYEGLKIGASRLSLPVGATQDLFIADAATGSTWGMGVSDMELEGIGNTNADLNGINLSAIERLEYALFDSIYAHNFNIAIRGSQNDRKPIVTGCLIWGNYNGYYVENNHPFFERTDFRDNEVGIMTDNLYDFQINQCVFTYNNYGLGGPTGTVTQGTITNSIFFGNNFGARVSNRVSFTGCMLISQSKGASNNDPDAVGITMTGSHNSWVGGLVSAEAGFQYAKACFNMPPSAFDGEYNTISGAEVRGQDNFVLIENDRTRGVTVSGNTGDITGHLVKTTTTQADGVQFLSVTKNQFDTTGTNLTASDGIIDIPVVHYFGSTSGAEITSNRIWTSDDLDPAYAIRADLRGSNCSGNIIKRTAGIGVINSDVNTINQDNILT